MRQPILDAWAIALWNEGSSSLQMIADEFGVTRQAVKAFLNKHGLDTSKAQSHRLVICAYCEKSFLKVRSRIRKTTKNFCTHSCYVSSIGNPDYIQNRSAMKRARVLISQVFPLEPEHVVHHIDGNNFNNDFSNLIVFKNQGDHLRWHRLDQEKSGVVPLLKP